MLLFFVARTFAALLPAGLALALAVRATRGRAERLRLLGTAALGLLGAAIALGLERLLGGWAGLDRFSLPSGDPAAYVFVFLVAAPLEQGLSVAAAVPAWRVRSGASKVEGLLVSTASSSGFALGLGLLLAWRAEGYLDVLRALLAAPAYVLFASLWGYVLGLDAHQALRSSRFNTAWLVATGLWGVTAALALDRSPLAVLGAAPVVATGAALTWFLARDLALRDGIQPTPRSEGGIRAALAPPSMRTVRAALDRGDRPLMLRWIAYGAFVQVGVLIAMVACAVAVGHETGVNFAAAERGVALEKSLPPVALLGAFALAAFPVSGYLVARASGARTVFEPAMASGVAIVAVLGMLGIAAPVAVVFALAFVPIAFGLACIGAWAAITR